MKTGSVVKVKVFKVTEPVFIKEPVSVGACQEADPAVVAVIT